MQPLPLLTRRYANALDLRETPTMPDLLHSMRTHGGYASRLVKGTPTVDNDDGAQGLLCSIVHALYADPEQRRILGVTVDDLRLVVQATLSLFTPPRIENDRMHTIGGIVRKLPSNRPPGTPDHHYRFTTDDNAIIRFHEGLTDALAVWNEHLRQNQGIPRQIAAAGTAFADYLARLAKLHNGYIPGWHHANGSADGARSHEHPACSIPAVAEAIIVLDFTSRDGYADEIAMLRRVLLQSRDRLGDEFHWPRYCVMGNPYVAVLGTDDGRRIEMDTLELVKVGVPSEAYPNYTWLIGKGKQSLINRALEVSERETIKGSGE